MAVHAKKVVVFPIVALLLFCHGPVFSQVGNTDLVAQAKKEGRVSWYTTVSLGPRQPPLGDRAPEGVAAEAGRASRQ